MRRGRRIHLLTFETRQLCSHILNILSGQVWHYWQKPFLYLSVRASGVCDVAQAFEQGCPTPEVGFGFHHDLNRFARKRKMISTCYVHCCIFLAPVPVQVLLVSMAHAPGSCSCWHGHSLVPPVVRLGLKAMNLKLLAGGCQSSSCCTPVVWKCASSRLC